MYNSTPIKDFIKTSKYYPYLKMWIQMFYDENEKKKVYIKPNYNGDLVDFYLDEATSFVWRCAQDESFRLNVTNIEVLSVKNGRYIYEDDTPVVFLGCLYIALTECGYNYIGLDKSCNDILDMMKTMNEEATCLFIKMFVENIDNADKGLFVYLQSKAYNIKSEREATDFMKLLFNEDGNISSIQDIADDLGHSLGSSWSNNYVMEVYE